ncbi:DUF4351 domain-containing protein [Merismopedia glauca]|uniref:DUF4351 domain-containing protein n=1 Tax=Merismopedia glauca CCAP 1448/3 TaxID=1296344 RepID=A0A2T1CAD9_9CYAN|nr:DUF4351 domain-containing protein [Merismopedia glauca]PSB05103.1 hypothetical protein C7B64_00940 [Merismopedia glauca CCAP 1448/3]
MNSQNPNKTAKSLTMQVDELSLEQLEALGEALLDFEGLEDLQNWLSSR